LRSAGLGRRVVWRVGTNILEEPAASIFRVIYPGCLLDATILTILSDPLWSTRFAVMHYPELPTYLSLLGPYIFLKPILNHVINLSAKRSCFSAIHNYRQNNGFQVRCEVSTGGTCGTTLYCLG
jgi:hypothetical protein